ncbi:hypothetical protein LUZ60_005051 [Juncus effusus]|nr:hypothetical protein LUZ60_005051 [Juncus effusus]
MRNLLSSGPTRVLFQGHAKYPYLPHLLMMIVITVLVSRILHRFLCFLKQPLIVCQLLAGVLVFSFLPKPSKEGSNDGGMILNPQNRRVDYVVGWVGLLFYFFMHGVKLNPAMHLQLGKRKETLIIGCSSLFVPMAAGFIIYCTRKEQLELLDANQDRYIALTFYVLSATFPVAVYEILEELCLLNSELGRLAVSSTMMQACFGWSCLVVFTAVSQGEQNTMHGFKALICVLAIYAFIVLVIYPYAQWIVRTTPPPGRVREVHIIAITFVVLLMGFLSDMSGSTTYVDAAMATGFAIPDGPPLGTALIERVDVVASGVLLPVIFMNEGIVANVAAALYLEMSLKNGLLLGIIMNFRGFVDMTMGRTTVGVLILANIIVLAICVPVVSIYYKPLAAREQIWLRTVERAQLHAELNVMVCFNDDKPVQALLEFHESLSFTLETNNSACIYTLHLVEKQGRAASSLIFHRNEKGEISTVQMDPVHNYFLNFEQAAKRSAGINVMPFTSVAPLNSMHHDICSLVLEKNIALVIVPYPKKYSIADLEASTATHRLVPLVLENAPCSVGIMVYHGTTRIMEDSHWQYHVCVIFWGGADDRESIAISSRMARHPGVYISVIRFLTSGSTTNEKDVAANDDDKKVLDDKMIAELQVANAGNNRVTVSEVSVSNVDQVISTIQAIGNDKYDLLIAGRRQENLSVLGDGLTKWTVTPELGLLGDMLSTDIPDIANLLIVQQHIVT